MTRDLVLRDRHHATRGRSPDGQTVVFGPESLRQVLTLKHRTRRRCRLYQGRLGAPSDLTAHAQSEATRNQPSCVRPCHGTRGEFRTGKPDIPEWKIQTDKNKPKRNNLNLNPWEKFRYQVDRDEVAGPCTHGSQGTHRGTEQLTGYASGLVGYAPGLVGYALGLIGYTPGW